MDRYRNRVTIDTGSLNLLLADELLMKKFTGRMVESELRLVVPTLVLDEISGTEGDFFIQKFRQLKSLYDRIKPERFILTTDLLKHLKRELKRNGRLQTFTRIDQNETDEMFGILLSSDIAHDVKKNAHPELKAWKEGKKPNLKAIRKAYAGGNFDSEKSFKGIQPKYKSFIKKVFDGELPFSNQFYQKLMTDSPRYRATKTYVTHMCLFWHRLGPNSELALKVGPNDLIDIKIATAANHSGMFITEDAALAKNCSFLKSKGFISHDTKTLSSFMNSKYGL
jgi:hypothetical protein